MAIVIDTRKRGAKAKKLDLKKVEELAHEGLGLEHIATHPLLGMSRSTFYELKAKREAEGNTDILDAIACGKASRVKLAFRTLNYLCETKKSFAAAQLILKMNGYRTEDKVERIVEKEFGGDPESIAKAYMILKPEEKQKTIEEIKRLENFKPE